MIKVLSSFLPYIHILFIFCKIITIPNNFIMEGFWLRTITYNF
nr:MAG TPA: hypothetical protein [Bacteriophage sp.]